MIKFRVIPRRFDFSEIFDMLFMLATADRHHSFAKATANVIEEDAMGYGKEMALQYAGNTF
jgi:hypothetical protein